MEKELELDATVKICTFRKRWNREELLQLRALGVTVANALLYIDEAYSEIDRLERLLEALNEEKREHLSDADLDELINLLEESTPSPWVPKFSRCHSAVSHEIDGQSEVSVTICHTLSGRGEDDARLISRMRNLLPVLISELKFYRSGLSEKQPITRRNSDT